MSEGIANLEKISDGHQHSVVVRYLGDAVGEEGDLHRLTTGVLGYDRAVPLSPGTVLVTVPAGVSIAGKWFDSLITRCRELKAPVGIGLLDCDGVLVHAGGLAAPGDEAAFGEGSRPADSPIFSTDRHDVVLLAPHAQWIESVGHGVAAITNQVIGLFRGDVVAVLERPAEPTSASGLTDVSRAVKSAVFVDGSTGSLVNDRALVLEVAQSGPVVWRTCTCPGELRSELARAGVFVFEASEHSADTLASAFAVARILFLDDETVTDGHELQHLLRARPEVDRAILAGRSRPGAEMRCSRVLGVDDVSQWAEARTEPTPDRSLVRAISDVETVAGVTSVVIPVHGVWDLTRRCLESIDQNTDGAVEIIVVDDASPDMTLAELEQLSYVVVVCNETNLGFPASVNRGIAAARGEYVCVLNNDTEVTAGWLDEMLSTLSIDNTLMVGPRSNNISGIQTIREAPGLADVEAAHAWARRWSSERAGTSWIASRLVGFCLLARRQTFVDHGGFDEGFGIGNFEDDELSNRLRASGGLLRVADAAVVLHHGSATFSSLGTDYMATLASAATNHKVCEPAEDAVTVVVLSDGDHQAASSTVWSALGLADRFRIVERHRQELMQLEVARARRLGVEVFAADWTTEAGATAALADLATAELVVVLNAGELVEVTDWGAARAELEQLGGRAAGIDVSGRAEVRIHRPSADLLSVVGRDAETVVQSIRVRALAEVDERRSSRGPKQTASLVGLVLSDSSETDWLTTIESARTVTNNVVLLDCSGSSAAYQVPLGHVADLDGVVFDLDWTEHALLAGFLDQLSAERMLVLAAGERLIVDEAGWAADLCRMQGDTAFEVSVGEGSEIRLALCHGAAVDAVGQKGPEALTSSGLRIVPPGVPHSDVTSVRFPELASHAAIEVACEGDSSMAERLAECLVLDEQARLLAQCRRERPIDWLIPADRARVGVVVPFDPIGGTTVEQLDATLASLARQSHIPNEVIVATPPYVDLSGVSSAFRHVEHHGLLGTDKNQARLARLANIGCLAVEGEWVALIDAGDLLRSDHISHSLEVAYADASEYVHGLVAVFEGSGTTAISRADDRTSESGKVGPVLFSGELRALQLRPTSVDIPEDPGPNRAARLRVIGVLESSAEHVTATNQMMAPSRAASNGCASVDSIAPAGIALHLGCGPNLLEGWVNIDLDAAYQPDLVHDLSSGLPYQDDSVDLVFSEHFFEHLALRDGLTLMAECHRVLRPGARIRIAMPDLRSTVHAYMNNWREQAWVKDYPSLETAAQMLNLGMREWGHQYVYDLEDLTLRLESVGFEQVSPCRWGISARPELSALETRADSLLVVEAVAAN